MNIFMVVKFGCFTLFLYYRYEKFYSGILLTYFVIQLRTGVTLLRSYFFAIFSTF